jgi:hypothetical protein
MRVDLYTKAVLTIIALALVLVAGNHYVHPATTASAQGSFVGLQFADSGGATFFDPRTGELFEYTARGGFDGKYRLTKLGQSMVKEK